MFSASSEARDRNAPTNANQIRLQTSRIRQEHRPIRYQLPARLSFRQGHLIYGSVVTRRLRSMGIRDRPTSPASPWQNGFAERLIGSIRRECVDHVIVLGEVHLRQSLQSYARYYNDIRTP